MPGESGTVRGTASTPEPDGVVSGALLRASRVDADLTRQGLADGIGADINTVKSWETGRRSLANVPVRTMRGLVQHLHLQGASPDLIDSMDTALDVDDVLAELIAGPVMGREHPLASVVHTRSWHTMLGWPIQGLAPSVVRYAGVDVPAPNLAATSRRLMFENLRAAADATNGDPSPRSALLRRQAYFVAAWDESTTGRDWLEASERAEARRLRPANGWTPAWVAGRSLAVARASQGDPDRLRAFMHDHLVDDQREAANLSYWAYWVGEYRRPASTDEFMTDRSPTWRGDRLIRHLVAALQPSSAYVELTAHSLWSLLLCRRNLLAGEPALEGELRGKIMAVLDSRPPHLGERAERELNQILYRL